MARSAVSLFFGAILALLSMQAPAPSLRLIAAFEMEWRTPAAETEAEQQAPRNGRRLLADTAIRQPAPPRVSFPRPEPDTILLFQLPPPTLSFFS